MKLLGILNALLEGGNSSDKELTVAEFGKETGFQLTSTLGKMKNFCMMSTELQQEELDKPLTHNFRDYEVAQFGYFGSAAEPLNYTKAPIIITVV